MYISSYICKAASESIANMCYQYLCYFCGRDLNDNQRIILCSNPSWMLRTESGDHRNCIEYINFQPTGAPILCNVCLEVDLIAGGPVLVPANLVPDYLE